MVEWHGMCVCKARERLGSTTSSPTLHSIASPARTFHGVNKSIPRKRKGERESNTSSNYQT